MPGGCIQAGGTRGRKNPGAPKVAAMTALASLATRRDVSVPQPTVPGCQDETWRQNSRRAWTRRSGGLPAIREPLIAPMEMPAIQRGVTPSPISSS